MDYLETRWGRLWNEAGADAPKGSYDAIIAAYAEDHRHYHDIGHIMDCLEIFDWHSSIAVDPWAVELSIWLHDFVYDVRAKDNELKSADYAEQLLKSAGLEGFIFKVRLLIESTAHSDLISLEGDQAFLSDIDLSILGSRSDIYNLYATHVHKEYSFVHHDVYCASRAVILSKFIGRSSIYSTPEFQLQYEDIAIKNIREEIAHLLS